jgi:hypothetical protein
MPHGRREGTDAPPGKVYYAMKNGSAGLAAGDTVYIAASPGYSSLASGAYHVASVPTADSFILQEAYGTPGDFFNFLARVGDTPGTVSF